MKKGKASLRKKYIFLRKNNKKKNIFNFNIIFKIIKKHFFKKKVIIAGYYPSNHEVNILNLLKLAEQKNFKIALPAIKSKTAMAFKLWKFNEPLGINNFGILEPKKTNKEVIPDLILVPLVAFDQNLNRIGYGKGYYDRCLKKIKKNNQNTICLGIAYSFQQSQNIPVDKHDFKLDYIFTDRGIISSK